MEFIFGTVWHDGVEKENLKVVGDYHTDLKGFQYFGTNYPDRIVTDTFWIVEKYLSKEDPSGRCYDWYIIDKHSRDTDTFVPAREGINERAAKAEQDLTDLEIAQIEDEQMLTDHDIAILELQAAVE